MRHLIVDRVEGGQAITTIYDALLGLALSIRYSHHGRYLSGTTVTPSVGYLCVNGGRKVKVVLRLEPLGRSLYRRSYWDCGDLYYSCTETEYRTVCRTL
jgi:hypothetical protein